MTPRVFVIGGGAMGLGAAIEFGRRGLDVTVADRGQQANGSSWAGAGILSTLPPWGYPEEVSRLAVAGMHVWPEWAAALEKQSGISPEFWTCGMEVMLAGAGKKTYPLPTSPGERGRSMAPSPLAGEGGGGVNHSDVNMALDWCQIHDLPVEVRPESIWLPNISQVRNPRLLAAMKEAVITQSGKILANCEVKGFKTEGGRITTAHTTLGDQHADQFVLAAGAWSGLSLGGTLPAPHVRPMRGQMLLYPPGSHDLEHIILRDGFYLVPRRDGHLLAGSTIEDAGFDASTTPEILNALQQKACQLLPSLKNHDPIKSWAGLRPGSPDNLPIIDRHPDFENLWVHTGHFRYGVTMAPASSKLLAELMTGSPPSVNPAPYSWQAALERKWSNGN